MAILYLSDGKSSGTKPHMAKASVRKLLAARDEQYQHLFELYDAASCSARHRFVKMHEGFSKIEKLEASRVRDQWIIRGLIGYNVLLTIIWCASGHSF